VPLNRREEPREEDDDDAKPQPEETTAATLVVIGLESQSLVSHRRPPSLEGDWGKVS
jgi:hypothetical protein